MNHFTRIVLANLEVFWGVKAYRLADQLGLTYEVTLSALEELRGAGLAYEKHGNWIAA